MASVGLGMSALAANGSDGFAICSHASAAAPGSDRQNPNPTLPVCPFCYVAAQCAGHNALVDQALALPAYTDLPITRVADRIRNDRFVPQFRRTVGAPRAPPTFSA
jgi:hypothetical protein